MVAARSSQARQNAERAVLVAVEFTGERRKLTSAARLARKAAAVSADSGAWTKATRGWQRLHRSRMPIWTSMLRWRSLKSWPAAPARRWRRR